MAKPELKRKLTISLLILAGTTVVVALCLAGRPAAAERLPANGALVVLPAFQERGERPLDFLLRRRVARLEV